MALCRKRFIAKDSIDATYIRLRKCEFTYNDFIYQPSVAAIDSYFLSEATLEDMTHRLIISIFIGDTKLK